MQKIALYGAGGLGRIAAELCAAKKDTDIAGFIDDKRKGSVSDIPIIGKWKDLASIVRLHGIDAVAVCLGDGFSELRWKAFRALETKKMAPRAVIHDRAVVSKSSLIGDSSIVMALTVVGPNVRIGRNCVIYSSGNMEHDDTIGDNVFISPGVKICGYVGIGDHSFIGANATIIPGVKIGSNVTIGAGATVIKDVPDNAVMAGNPAARIRVKKRVSYY